MVRKALFILAIGCLVFRADYFVFAAQAKYDWSPLEIAISRVINNQVLLNKLLHGNDNELQLLQSLQYYELELADIDRWRNSWVIGRMKLVAAGVMSEEDFQTQCAIEDEGWNEERFRLCEEFLQLVDDLNISKSIRKELGL